VAGEFQCLFGHPASHAVRSPGRVNLIGDHTDYNNGFVLPMAIDRAVYIALRPTGERRVTLHALDFGEEARFELNELTRSEDPARGDTPGNRAPAERPRHDWMEYIRGVAWALQEAGHRLQGWQGVIAGDVPLAAGLSSSAALELAAARAFATASGITWNPTAMARLCQRAENRWVGVQCGIMDQLIAARAVEGHALLIDCRSLAIEVVPLPPACRVVVLDTGIRRELAGSAYNTRRVECAAAARHFDVDILRDLDEERFQAGSVGMDDTLLRRARHVLTENARVLQAAEALRCGKAAELGRLMDASHCSLRDDFEVSSAELDVMVDCARQHDGCLGARLTGAGFGGCAVALVMDDAGADFGVAVGAAYRSATGLAPAIHVCRAAGGVSLSTLGE
jgi:galactokinase